MASLRTGRLWMIGSLALAVASGTVPAQSIRWEAQRVLPSDHSSLNLFGFAVDVDGDRAAVGAWKKGDAGPYSGAVYLFQWTGNHWVEEQKLNASDAAQEDQFGFSLDLNGDWLIVGSSKDDDAALNAGTAYIFEFSNNTWQEVAKILPSDAGEEDEFGAAVAINDQFAIVGAPFDDDDGDKSGSASVFQRNGSNWAFVEKLTAFDASNGDQYGGALGLVDSTLLVGASLDNENGFDDGSVYVYEWQGGQFVDRQKLGANDPSDGAQFGASIHVEGDLLAVGARKKDESFSNQGAVYLFQKGPSQWVQTTKLVASDGLAGDEFGHDVAFSGDVLVAGANGADDAGDRSGAAYLFRRVGGQWLEQNKLLPSDGENNDEFGYAVGIQEHCALVGSVFDNTIVGNDAGTVSAYLVSEVALQVSPGIVAPGSGISFSQVGGQPSTLTLYAATAVNGSPIFLQLLWDQFDGQGESSWGGTVPFGLSGLEGTFQTIGFSALGTVEISNPMSVTFQ